MVMSEQFAAGAIVHGKDGPVASVRSVALSPATLEATWLVLAVLDVDHVTAVPTSAASVDQSGTVRIPFTRDELLQAPDVGDAVDEQLSSRLQRALGLV